MPRRAHASARFLLAALAVLFASVLGIGATPTGAAADGTLAQRESRLVELHNAARARHGLPPLEIHPVVVDRGREFSRTMAANQDLEHQTADNGYDPTYVESTCEPADPSWWVCGENVGRGMDAQALHDGFMASSEHRANILHPDVNRVGVGVWRDDHGMVWWTVRFLAGSGSVDGTPTPHPQDGHRAASAPETGGRASSSTADDRFVAAAFQLFVGRTPTGAERSAGRQALAAGQARADVISQLATSDEWLGHEIDQVYAAALGRAADDDGRRYWADQVRAGARLADVGVHVFASDEFFRTNGGTAEGFVQGLYRKILGRSGDEGGVQHWAARLHAGGSRADIAASFYRSLESRTGRVTGLYHRILGRSADEAGLRHWADRLLVDDDVRLATVLAGSDEFYARSSSA